MNKEGNNIDQYFRDGLQDYESPVATNLWDKLDAAREEEKKPKGIIWWKWALGASLLILLIGSSFYFLNTAQEEINLPASKVETDQSVTSIPKMETTEQASNTIEETTQVIVSDKAVLEVTKNKSTHNIALPTEKLSTRKSINESNSTSTTANISATSVGITTPTPQTQTNSISKENKNTTSISTITSSQSRETKLNNTQPITTVTESESVEKSKTTQRLDFLKTTSATVLDSPANLSSVFDAPPIKIPFSWGPKGCYSFAGGRIKYDYYVDAFVSPEYAIRKLSAKTPEDENYRQRRDETEATLYGLSGGVRLSVVTRRGLALRTGIVYNRILERFNLEKEGDTLITQVFQPGTMDTITTIETGTTVVRTYNRYHSLDIPLLLGYEVDLGNFNFNINAGAYFNIYARQKGKILSQSDEPEFITSNNPQRINAFEKDLGISIYGSIGLNYQIRPGLQLLIEPNLRYQLKPISLATYPLEQQYINVGLLLGVRRQF